MGIKMLKIIMTILFLLLFLSSGSSRDNKPLPVEKISLPDNFSIEIYSSGIETARGMDFSDSGVLFVGSKDGNVYAIAKDKQVFIIDKGLDEPAGVDYFDGDLFVSAISKILKYEDILDNLVNPPEPVIVNDSFPDKSWHGRKFIKIGPDKKLYVPVGAPCNVCIKEDERFASIMRMDIDGGSLEMYAYGVRNTVGFDWHPVTGELWFTDNGRDLLGDDIPPDELNRAYKKGLHFGFPYLHGKDVKDPEYYDERPGIDFTTPEHEFPAHVAALGMRFYTGDMFPKKYKGGIFVAEHGSWNRSEKIGYRVSFVSVKDNKATGYETFASGWLENDSAWGRPADVQIGPDGALYVSDDKADAVYRISYKR
jgi:glucose/arabinose dehydrogenase